MMKIDVENPMVLPVKEKPNVGVAFCENCRMRLFADEEFLSLEGDYFCDELCLKDYLGVKTIEGWEVE